MIYQIVIDEPIKTTKAVNFPPGFEKQMLDFLKKKKLRGSVYQLGGRVIGRF